MAKRIGQVVSERWVLAEVVGLGGHSIVYRGVDREGGQSVAIKILRDELAGSEEHMVRLVREHRVMKQLAGTAAVRARGLASTPDGEVCLVMELLSGEDLDDVLAKEERFGDRMSLGRMRRLLEPLVETLERAHDLGITHRDLKPGNIYVMDGESDPGVRLIDFMLAKVRRARPLTRKGIIIGSPSYIAPEAWSGNHELVDHRVDIYSFGAIVFRVLAGRVPFEAPTLREKIELVTQGARPSLYALRPELPPDIDEWLQMVMALEPNRRFNKISAAWQALGEILDPGRDSGLETEAPQRDAG